MEVGREVGAFDPDVPQVFVGQGLEVMSVGGCEPFGMATVLADRSVPVEIWTSQEGPLLLRTVQNAEKRRVMTLAQADFQERVRRHGVAVHHAALSGAALVEMLDAGAMAILLISGNRMFGTRVPHWVVAWAADAGHVFLHDPWVETAAQETAADAISIPVPRAELDRMWRWGADRLRAVVVAWPGRAGPARG